MSICVVFAEPQGKRAQARGGKDYQKRKGEADGGTEISLSIVKAAGEAGCAEERLSKGGAEEISLRRINMKLKRVYRCVRLAPES